ncbi:S1C family serine protease [Candidatus Poriferisodalis sp.]|uniref:S1C family serine protease n=1 Tax=Candidatus Poriferisodalis sp. TaxID=3101277 RepID=UPI003B021663
MAEQDRTPVESDDRATGMPAAAAAEPAAGSAVQRSGPTSGSTRRPGCLLVGIAGAVGALIGALTAGLLLVIVLAGDDSPDTAAPTNAQAAAFDSSAQAEADSNISQQEAIGAGVADDAASDDNTAAQATPPEGSTGDADFWSQVLANSNLFGTSPDGGSGAQSGDGSVDLSPDLLADIWAQMLAGESSEPGAPLGSRIEGINIKAVLEAVQESVVIVNAPTAENPGRGGSGFIVAADGHIVTNEHVVRDAETVEVRLFGGELLPAEVVASDPTRDLAVLKVDRDGLPAVRLGSTEGVEVGDEVIAIGNALGIVGEPTVTSGIVSGLNRDITLPDDTRLVRLIQTDAAINPGNSGGPLVNAAGEVIGVNTAIPALSSTNRGIAEGIGYAISIDHARPIIDQLLEGVVQAKAYLGVRVTSVEDFIAANETPEQAPEDDSGGELGDGGPETVEPGPDPDDPFSGIELLPEVTSGALVVGVDPGEAAERAGIEPGDVIIEFEGTEILTSNDLVLEILARLPGDRVEMGVIGNDGKLRKVELELGSFIPEDTES